MSNDMSMFKKMKERITDEVNSATNKLQSMQIMDQLATSIGQQLRTEIPEQQLPETPSLSHVQSKLPRQQFSLIDDNAMENFGEEEELNSEMSPQHQLFNEKNIQRIHSASNMRTFETNGASNHQILVQDTELRPESPISLINILELNSDIDDGFDDRDGDANNEDIEIDLLNDSPTNHQEVNQIVDSPKDISKYKSKYKNLVHQIRSTCREFKNRETKYEQDKQQSSCQITTLRRELEDLKQQLQKINQNESLMTTSTLSVDNESIGRSSPQPTSKTSAKLRDLERLLSKCKESLKLKNAQMESLKESLADAEKYKDYNEELKKEIEELRLAQETWTVSIAENKRVMHQELEDKNVEMNKLRNEISELQAKIAEGQGSLKNARSAIQDLESRVVSTSVAHQKERESLIKELNAAKATALKKQQQESEYQFQRMKLDLEKSIENLKAEILSKDELLMKNIMQQQHLQESNSTLNVNLANKQTELDEVIKSNEEFKSQLESCNLKTEELTKEVDSLKSITSTDKNSIAEKEALETEVHSLKSQIERIEAVNRELEARLEIAGKEAPTDCDTCEYLDAHFKRESERMRQEIHELNTNLKLMNSANDDQEKEIASLKDERESILAKQKSTAGELEELRKKNDTLIRLISENENDLQSQQEQLENLSKLEQQHKALMDKNQTLSQNFSELNSELADKRSELKESQVKIEELHERVEKLETELKISQNLIKELSKEKDTTQSQMNGYVEDRRQREEQMIIKILATMKNLETPNTSPGSDKSYESIKNRAHDTDAESEEHNDKLPDPIIMMDKLSSLALDRCQSHQSTTQRLNAVILENTMISEELQRIKEELNTINRESSIANQCSLNEVQKLETENQALISDQINYDERIKVLEEQIEVLNTRLAERDTDECFPSATEFEYLKNIVHQFMLGRQPLVLARVISAVFKFDKDQIEQICRIQESIHTSTTN